MKGLPVKNYRFSILLTLALFGGTIAGLMFKSKAVIFKPFGDVFLNLLFTIVVPLVFFSISSAVASMVNARRLGKILSAMLFFFIMTGIVSSLLMITAVKLYPPAQGL